LDEVFVVREKEMKVGSGRPLIRRQQEVQHGNKEVQTRETLGKNAKPASRV
jgi:hypothetical protein